VFSSLYVFGLKAGVGADTLSLFFKMIRIDTHVGISPVALRTQINKMERLLPQFQEECEKSTVGCSEGRTTTPLNVAVPIVTATYGTATYGTWNLRVG